MTLKLRFSLIGFGIILFLIVTPILALYARGFMIDFNTRQIVKTGAMVIKTDPAKAAVYLNGKQQQSLTPTNIRFMAPADYDVRIEKAGFQTWTKRLNVRQQFVTWINLNREAITLFLKDPKLEQTWITDNAKPYTDVEVAKIINIQQPVPMPIDSWFLENNQLKYKKSDTDNPQIIADNIPPFTKSQIIRAENQIHLILDDALYAVNNGLEKIYSPVLAAAWDPASKQLIFGNNNEILIYNPSTKNTDLILRSSSQISHPMLNSETGYVFFTADNKIKAIELDSRDKKNIFDLVADLGNFTISTDGRTLYTFNNTKINKYTIR